MVGNQLHSFKRRCGRSQNPDAPQISQPCVKLVIQVEHGKIWLPKGMKATNFPKVVISQPHDSMPFHLKQVLAQKGLERRSTRTSSCNQMDFEQDRGNMSRGAHSGASLFEDNSLRISQTEKGSQNDGDRLSEITVKKNSATFVQPSTQPDHNIYMLTEDPAPDDESILILQQSSKKLCSSMRSKDYIVPQRLSIKANSQQHQGPISEQNFQKLKPQPKPIPVVKNGQVQFTTMRQELLKKPDPNLLKGNTAQQTTECTWSEPFVLYYDDQCDSDSHINDESKLKFAIQMGYDEIVTQRKRDTQIVEHLVGEFESFHIDQFSEGQIYLKEIRFGSKQSKNDILGFETSTDDELAFGGTLLCKIQLLREEGEMLEEVMASCSQKVLALQDYSQYLKQ